ncbi:MAG: ABC transporter permease [Bacteroidales bacterium]|jgi:ABC-2 type transport system permease protein|nr:ABC transporter permease [Bacteroidales bacterium]MDD2770643.1 ABC transporter permease [Bacteroidales bacterium]MDD3105850.1 ABC transporter permease [Bacteroidales bacterium]MDD3549330.1 ABC transporter permease [Bacteroidales bacterium]MDD4064715.1 ABC transporter permease [Bacteroidales bacterium]
MKYIYFAGRNSKEILRDPLSLILAGVLPVVFIVLFSLISRNAPIEVFQPVNIVPGLTVFGFTFITMFLGMLIAKDKSSSFLTRLFISPLKPRDFILGYFIPVLPMAAIIAVSCLVTGLFVGIPLSVKLVYTFLSFIPFVLFSGFFGIFLGILCRETQVMAIGNIYIIASALLGGAWMDLEILGKTLKNITDFLPFSHAIEASRIVLSGRQENLWLHLGVVCLYALVFFVLAVFFFRRKMRSDNS